MCHHHGDRAVVATWKQHLPLRQWTLRLLDYPGAVCVRCPRGIYERTTSWSCVHQSWWRCDAGVQWVCTFPRPGSEARNVQVLLQKWRGFQNARLSTKETLNYFLQQCRYTWNLTNMFNHSYSAICVQIIFVMMTSCPTVQHWCWLCWCDVITKSRVMADYLHFQKPFKGSKASNLGVCGQTQHRGVEIILEIPSEKMWFLSQNTWDILNVTWKLLW